MSSDVSKERLVADMKTVVTDAGELLKGAAASSNEGMAAARDRLRQRMGALRSRMSETQSMFSGRARYAADCTEHYVRAHPWKSMGIAAAAALLVGALFRRR
jgi:ElaB/YqjD/DUF883 family membrane-anchored ribosome-binding protein